ncbi:hypothetical protein GQ53DRAFT_755986 [Thozetella sp. PMI_491]|nr:hypothetical protein GQ53DRAFT_755986 [Thozetella sp. PMI_491]
MSSEESPQRKDSVPEATGIANTSPFGSPNTDRRMSAEWDASKVPPSRFQKRKGSIYAVPSSRDGHVDSNYQEKFHDLHTQKGYHKTK